MINNLTFFNSHWVWQISIAAIILWLVFAWKERSHISNKPRFIIKICLAFIAITSLALIALKPLTPISNRAIKAVLLTNGYDSAQLDSLKKAYKKLRIYNYKINTSFLNDADVPESLFVLGHGLKPFDLWQLDSVKTKYLGGNEPKGVTRLKYNKKTNVGNLAIFNGLYNKATKGHVLVLEGPAGLALDSIVLSSENVQKIKLSANLNIQGKYLFHLVEKDTLGNTITKDPLPVNVIKQNPLKILIINSNPTFETKYLKNYLAEMGHRVLIRSQLTKGHYKFEYFNMSKKPLVSFTQKSLELFDIVIIDANSLKELSRRALNTLEKSVRENGLGLFIQPDDWYYSASINISPFNFISEKITEMSLDEWPKIKITKHAFRFKNEFQLQAIHKSNKNFWTAYRRLGEGRVGTTVLQNTYELLLNGHTKAYHYLWSNTIESLSKKELPVNEWRSNTTINFRDEPFNFQLRTTIDRPIVTTIEGYNIAMRRDIDIKSLWEGTTYPHGIGWKKHTVLQDTTETFQYYVTDTTHWRSLSANNIIETNKRYFNNQVLIEDIQNKATKPINPLWFFLVFILSMGYLWLEPKL